MPKRRLVRSAAARRAAAAAAKAPARPARRKTASKKGANDSIVVTIRTKIGKKIVESSILSSAPIIRLAEEWSYLLRSRARWVEQEKVRLSLRDRALADLQLLGVKPAFIAQLANVSNVEVELHPWTENAAEGAIHEAASQFPWEYLISSSTRKAGRYLPILITRLFRNGARAIIPRPPENVLFVESSPGRLYDWYDFESERKRIAAAVGAKTATRTSSGPFEPVPLGGDGDREIRFSLTETTPDLRRTIRDKPWEAIHVSGVDTHQASVILDNLYENAQKDRKLWRRITDGQDRVLDGMILRHSNVSELPVSYRELAEILVNEKQPPRLVTLNLYHSGARIGRELVARGARAAVGFLDEVDDELAELFFQAFYWAWCRPNGALGINQAFVEAWDHLSGNRLHGTGIVLWLGRSVFDAPDVKPRDEVTSVPDERPARLEKHNRLPVSSLLSVEIEVPKEVNYSLLHNQRPLLGKLTLTKLVKEPLEDIQVTVELNLGSENYPFRCTLLDLREPQMAMASMVQIPLTASLPRALQERVHSTVYIKVCCGGRIAKESTRRVTLIPVDEWVDDTDNNPWLPSFVLPRDPAILKIIQSSRRFLVGIRDDAAAGFDGYQAVDDSLDDPLENVDAQVRAIWTALVNEYRIQYINPPPSYSDQSQRLRTPTEILSSGTGTCIDLALLLASCLEYIDIYPVVVLLTGHAFVGYWRSDARHEAFLEMRNLPAGVPAPGDPVAREAQVPFVDQYGWRLTKLQYDEIMTHIASGDLVMLEATYLTSASSFAEAVKEGRANMRSKRQFDSLLDIRSARCADPPVTPLPIIDET
jgi:hypothetical protein